MFCLPKNIKTDNAPAYTSKAFAEFVQKFNITHTTGIPYNPQGQAIIERAHQTLKTQISKLQKAEFKYSSPHQILQHALYVINILNLNIDESSAMSRHWAPTPAKPATYVKWKDLLSGQWKGPDILLTRGRGFACIFPQDAESPIWIPDRLIRPCHGSPTTT